MIIISAGKTFNDIDAFACALAYRELLEKEGKGSLVVFPGPLNHSVTDLVKQQSADFVIEYTLKQDDRTIYVEGAASLLDTAEELTLGTPHAFVQMIEEKQKLVRRLNEYIDGPGLTIVIGAEHPNPSLRPLSLIASTYNDGTGIGTVGVIGPIRMRYSRAIAVVDGAAQAVSRVLRDQN